MKKCDCLTCRRINEFKHITPICDECGGTNTNISELIGNDDNFSLLGYCFDCGEPFFFAVVKK